MSPPQPQPCQVPGCDYNTPLNIPNYELVYRDLSLHFQMVHAGGAANDAGDSSLLAFVHLDLLLLCAVLCLDQVPILTP